MVAPQLQIDRFLSFKVEVLWVAVDSGGLLDAPGSFVAAGSSTTTTMMEGALGQGGGSWDLPDAPGPVMAAGGL